MFKYGSLCVLLLHTLVSCRAALPEHQLQDAAESSPFDCLTNSLESSASLSLYCRGTRAIRNVIHNLSKSDKPIVIVRGLEIVPSKDHGYGGDGGGGNSAYPAFVEAEDDSFLGRFSAYLRTHELNIKFSDLLAEQSERYTETLAMEAATAARDLERNDGVKMAVGSDAAEARKKDKGQGIILTMALMFAKILAVMGLSGVGALAIKALGVGMTALMLSGIVGIKTLAHQGQEHSHNVQYVTDGGHHHVPRRRRSVAKQTNKLVLNPLPLVYWGWPRDMKRDVKGDKKRK